MSLFLQQIQALRAIGKLRISDHGYNELAEDGLLAGELLDGLSNAHVIEEYPQYPKGPCVLVLQKDSTGSAVHVVWGIPRGASEPAVLVTAYRPDPARWTTDFLQRRS